MSVEATSRAWHSRASGNGLLVMLALADVAGGEDDPYDHAYPSVERVMKMTKLSRRTVQRALRDLEADGYVRTTGKHDWGGGKFTNIYRIETGRQDDAPVTDDAPRGVTGGINGASPVTPNPSLNTVTEKVAEGSSHAVASDFPPEVAQVASALHSMIVVVFECPPTRYPITPAWHKEIERMHRLDGVPFDAILACIKWLEAGQTRSSRFWRTNIRSAKKLREKFDVMRAQARDERAGQAVRLDDGTMERARARRERAGLL